MSYGVVAIGRNEGERLRVCLASARRSAAPVVYVDSGSTDGSVEVARAMGSTVIELDLSIPFTAARARNEGFAKLTQFDPAIEFVQFVDGDCEIAEGWIDRAMEKVVAEPRAAVVCGRRRERSPGASIYNRLCDMEWNSAIGKARACGGDALIRAEAFRAIGGYDATVIAGEEPEMCARLRRADWEIWRIDAEMTLHDAAMTRFGQWWKRNLRGGHAYAEGARRYSRTPERMWVRESISIWIYAMLLPIVIAATSAFVSRWCLMLLIIYPLLAMKVAMYRHRHRGDRWPDAMLYGIFVTMGKWPQLQGQIRYWMNWMRGKGSRIIEYKGATAVS